MAARRRTPRSATRSAGSTRDSGASRDAHGSGRRLAVSLLALVLIVLAVVPGMRSRAQGLTSGVIVGISHWFTPRDAELERQKAGRMAAEARADQVADADRVVEQARRVSASVGAGRAIVTARVVAFSPEGAGGVRRVELDAGSRDGIATNEAVVAPGGLVGRVTAVTSATATVTLLDDDSSVVGARVEPGDVLARIDGTTPQGAANRAPGRVSLVLAQGGSVKAGAKVVTAGSPGGHPYPPGVTIGVVDSVDPARGQLERSAVVRPSADLGRLDVVGVLTGGGS